MATEDEFKAWVLHKRPIGNANIQVSFLTAERGILNCSWQHGRTPKKQALLQLFTPLWLFTKTNHNGWHYICQVETYDQPLRLTGDSLFAAFYLNELLCYALKSGDHCPNIFDIYGNTLRALMFNNINGEAEASQTCAIIYAPFNKNNNSDEIPTASKTSNRLALEILLRRFELILLQTCGYGLPFIQEAYSTKLITAHKHYKFNAGAGFIADPNGKILGKNILALADGQFADLEVLRTAKLIMRQAIAHFLQGRELKTRALFKVHNEK